MNNIIANKSALRLINKILILALLVTCGYFIFVFAKSSKSFDPSDYAIDNSKAPLARRISLKELSTYKKVVSSRELFRPFVLSDKKDAKVITIEDVTKDLVLVGVVSVDNKEAIIKNRRTRQTYFVTIGSTIGELKVLNISDNKIEVGYKEERKELFLR